MLRKTILTVLPALVSLIPTLAQAAVAAKPEAVDDRTEAAGVPAWGLGPFVRVRENPILKPRPESVFLCPIQKKIVP